MSRSYDFAVEVAPVETEELTEQIRNAIDEEMGSESQHYLGVTETDIGQTAFIDGCTFLCGGESEHEAHVRLRDHLRKEFPALKRIETKWLCTEYRSWDESFTWEENP